MKYLRNKKNAVIYKKFKILQAGGVKIKEDLNKWGRSTVRPNIIKVYILLI